MSKIKILSEILSNKIAAGEVIERPAAVVKELCENSLDAESEKIIIEIEKGGRYLIRVSDDGFGMEKDDALLSIERYATSKLYKDEDLFSIRTLGFRGEALPSIAAVSKFSLITREKNSDYGAKIYIEGGQIKEVVEQGSPYGTMIEVKDIFFNTPARRKFLKSINTETAHIADTVSSLALGWHDVSFSLIHNGKRIKYLPAAADPLDRVISVLGSFLKDKLHKIDFNEKNISVSGWIASPDETRSSSNGIYLFVNKRLVKDKFINYAIFESFKGKIIKGRYPVAVIFLNVSFDKVDVNVHPAKHEVRFFDNREIIDSIKKGIGKALFKSEKSKWLTYDKIEKRDFFIAEEREIYTPSIFEKEREEKKDFSEYKKQKSFFGKKKSMFSKCDIIGQFKNTYILCELEDVLISIDQHAAHERIIFETLKKNRENNEKASQRLLMPEIIEMNFYETEVLKKLIPYFLKMGIEIDYFGGNSFMLRTIPAVLSRKGSIGVIVKDVLENIDIKSNMEDMIDACLIEMACKGAIKANHKLSLDEMKTLLSDLDKCESPSNCPHGRPVWIKFSEKEFEKMFKRII